MQRIEVKSSAVRNHQAVEKKFDWEIEYQLAGERIECCKNDIIDDNLYCKNDRISADMLY